MSPCLLFPGHEGVQHHAGQCRVHLSRGRVQQPLSGQHTLDQYIVQYTCILFIQVRGCFREILRRIWDAWKISASLVIPEELANWSNLLFVTALIFLGDLSTGTGTGHFVTLRPVMESLLIMKHRVLGSYFLFIFYFIYYDPIVRRPFCGLTTDLFECVQYPISLLEPNNTYFVQSCGSGFILSRIPDPGLTRFRIRIRIKKCNWYSSKFSKSWIRGPKKAPDPGSGSATLIFL